MKVSDYIVEYLIQKGITDAFGIPGGVILEFLYALDRRRNEICPHLNYHEQASAFAACGYAQASGKLGVVYATRGPGVTNMVTAIAEAYYESIPILLITAHAAPRKNNKMRIELDQDMDPIPIIQSITKYSARIECLEEVQEQIEFAYQAAMTGRKGPVVLDVCTRLFNAELFPCRWSAVSRNDEENTAQDLEKCLNAALSKAHRPIFLIGNGVKQSGMAGTFQAMAERLRIPVISSHIAQDTMPNSSMYFGYIGSRGTRYGNFILSKADLIIALGNRMSFPSTSASFYPIVSGTPIIRVDVDDSEFLHEFPQSENFVANLADVLPYLAQNCLFGGNYESWVDICGQLVERLAGCDIAPPINAIAKLLSMLPSPVTLVSDVGNNALWLARAYAFAKVDYPVFYSKSFSSLGCSLAKGIGAYFATKAPVVCFSGDQGLQFNIQELQFLASNCISVVIVLLNNVSSGMIRTREKIQYSGHLVHTTRADGYSVPDFEAVAKAYGLGYLLLDEYNLESVADIMGQISGPWMIELRIEESIDLAPSLPLGNPCQDLSPPLSRELYSWLDQL